jgi:hypothetical protein
VIDLQVAVEEPDGTAQRTRAWTEHRGVAYGEKLPLASKPTKPDNVASAPTFRGALSSERSSSAQDRRGETNAGERPVRARTISGREEWVDDVGIERRFKGFFK